MSKPTSKEILTPRQQQILTFIQGWIKTHGYPPSVREIGAATGLRSSSTVHKHLKALEAKGALRRQHSKPRAIEVLANSPSTGSEVINPVIHVPIIGRVAAGLPLFAEENLEGTFPLPAMFSAKGLLFLLRVRGDSMKDAGILDGDYVLVRQQPKVENGEIAVVLIDNEATVKRFYQKKKYIHLQPANPNYDPIVVHKAQVLGKVTGVMRFIS